MAQALPPLGPPCRALRPGGLPGPPALPPSRSSWGTEGTLGCSRPDSSLLSPRLPKQVTLSTLSRPRFGLSHFYLRVHPEKEGEKNPEEIRVNWKEKNSKGCPQRRKSPDSADLQTTTRLSGGRGETASHPDPTRNPAPSATFPLLQAERTPLYHRRPPSWRWANTQTLNGHRRPASGSPFYTQSSPQYLRSYPCGKTLARQLFPAPIPTANNRLHSLLWSVSHPNIPRTPLTPFSRSCLSPWENSMGDEIKMKTCPPD
ncbi:PREDICTED: uncharacterized protein LOC104992011 [Bison bison bison]|uniref:Uncharacterized protein LOC104992011 n=1 Tax=Bison bison bison TaxID=43346 RepID=A0A6P3HKU6_BISBB|nr:PREDICTED: uncharacterized protein LOC104992011 [Bison bison bison]